MFSVNDILNNWGCVFSGARTEHKLAGQLITDRPFSFLGFFIKSHLRGLHLPHRIKIGVSDSTSEVKGTPASAGWNANSLVK